jgi:hypothetical protein
MREEWFKLQYLRKLRTEYRQITTKNQDRLSGKSVYRKQFIESEFKTNKIKLD